MGVIEMDMINLKTFHYCATYLSFSQAAQYLNISQPAVTNQIKKIEQHLNNELFIRAGRKLFLTDAGEILFTCSTKIFHLLDTALHEMDTRSKEMLRLRIAGDLNYLSMHLANFVPKLYEILPHIQIEVSAVEHSKKIFDGVRDSKYDIGIMSGNYSTFGIRQRLLSEDNVSLVTSKKIALALKENPTLDFPLLEYQSKSSYSSFLMDFMIQNKLIQKKRITFNNLELVRTALLNDAGIAILSEDVLKKDILSGKIEVLSTKKFKEVKIKTRLIFRTDNPMHSQIERCSELIMKEINLT